MPPTLPDAPTPLPPLEGAGTLDATPHEGQSAALAPEPLAEVEVSGRFSLVRLPPELEDEALVEFATAQSLYDQYVTATREPDGRIRLPRADTAMLLRALEEVKPERLDEHGVPLPWAPLTPVTVALGEAVRQDLEHDVHVVDELPADGPEPPPSDEHDWARAEFARLAALLGFPKLPLRVAPASIQQRGFCGGWIKMKADGTPLQVQITPCPNSDHAEVLATVLHELAHALTPRAGHGPTFCRRLVQLAGDVYGEGYFTSAPTAPPHGTIDRWVATGIRAALGKRPPPAPREADEGKLIAVVRKIRKLHVLADGQVGTTEGTTACALANDLITLYGLGGYHVQIAAGLDDQMTDRWLVLRRGVWPRTLAHAIAGFFSVFSLHNVSRGRVHLFGRHADLVASLYLFEVCEAAIRRGCKAHVRAWRSQAPRGRGEAARERTDFCSAAVRAFRKKLQALGTEGEGAERALAAAEELALVEHHRRGFRWGGASFRDDRTNAAGAQLGGALEVVRGVGDGPERRIAGPTSDGGHA